MDNNNLYTNGPLTLCFGALSEEHFSINPVWCEYYEISELDDIDVSMEWIQLNLLDRLESSNDTAYYSVAVNIDYMKRQFMNVACEFTLNNCTIKGYLFLILGQVNSVSIFMEDEVVDIYSSELLSEENTRTIHEIKCYFDIDTTDTGVIHYRIKSRPFGQLKSDGAFHFPVEP